MDAGMLRCATALVLSVGLAVSSQAAKSHPHVFIDGGVDFVMDEDGTLRALDVTWLYDPFETLYVLATLKITPDAEWRLSSDDRARLIAHESVWAGDFDGTSHLSIEGEAVKLARPTGFDVELENEQLKVTFRRNLPEPIDVRGLDVEVAVYEKTFFYSLGVTKGPKFIGAETGCATDVIRFDPDTQLNALQYSLFELSREETPEIENVGALFADRIVLKCD
ncbi:MAG: DUF1007 family protein [Pseudomonadota bacterium]